MFTLLSGPVENLDVFELHANPSSQRHRVGGVVLVASLNRAVSVRPVSNTIARSRRYGKKGKEMDRCISQKKKKMVWRTEQNGIE